MLWKLWPKIFLTKFSLYVFESQLTILPVFCYHFIKNNAKGIDVCMFFGFENDIIFIFQMFNRCINCLISVSSNQRNILLATNKSQSIDDHIGILNKDLIWSKTSMHHVFLMKLFDCFCQLYSK